ncbi:snaclec coagulation factor IX-binding protein subunit A-like [Carettochelys insculpta]|uniref:snaclec coagulation factor IX-binding protein subunit A-like n=1 Tax=Carettochelys insculpta TaxID=44489 RepID=UPI003EB884F7
MMLWWVPGCLGPFLALLLVGPAIPGASSEVRSCPCTQGCCPAGWYQYRDACYYPVVATKQWKEAEEACKNLVEGAHLASVHSAEENNFIYHLMGTPNDYQAKTAYWLGAYDDVEDDSEDEASWSWTDGSAWDYNNFGTGKPDKDAEGENFVASWMFEGDAIAWDNYAASLEFMSVCKRALD